MKIAYLITRMDEFGGAQVHVRDLCLWMQANGHAPFLLSGWPGKVSDFLEQNGVSYTEIEDLQRSIHPVKDFKAFRQIRKALKTNSPDLLTCHSSKAGILGRLAAWSLGIPVVFTAHGWAFTDGVPKTQRMIYKIIEKFCALFGDHIITVSEFDRDLALRNHIAPADRITAVWNGMPYAPPASRTHDATAPLKILMVARIGAQKDHARLLRSLSACTHKNWKLDFVGGGDDFELRRLSRELGLDDKVDFLGECSDIDKLMAQSDLYALITNWEGLPLTIIEAMRSGLPVVATGVGGVGELIVPNETGILIEPNSDEALTTALETLLKDRDGLEKMGQAGRKRYEEFFTFDAMAQKTLAVYERVTARIRSSQR